MSPRRDPETLCRAALVVLAKEAQSRIETTFYFSFAAQIRCTLAFLSTVMSSLPPHLTPEFAQNTLRCASKTASLRSSVNTTFIRLLVEAVIPENIMTFETSKGSDIIHRSVLRRLCDLRYLRTLRFVRCSRHEYLTRLQFLGSVLGSFRSLSNLRELHMVPASAKIMHVVGSYCPKLQLLIFQPICTVSGECVESLTGCKDLRLMAVPTHYSDQFLCKYRSNRWSSDAFRQLLEDLPRLERIGLCWCLKDVIANIRKRRKFAYVPLSLRKYESTKMPDEDVFFMCPNISSVEIYKASRRDITEWKLKLPSTITALKIQMRCEHSADKNDIGSSLNTILTSNIISLELINCVVTTDVISAVATVCINLRGLKLHSNRFEKNLRLSTKIKEPFSRLELLSITNSHLALDVLMIARRIRHVSVLYKLPARDGSLWADVSFPWIDIDVYRILDNNPMEHLESFELEMSCSLTEHAILNFLMVCPKLRDFGDIYRCMHDKAKIEVIHDFVRQENLAVQFRSKRLVKYGFSDE